MQFLWLVLLLLLVCAQCEHETDRRSRLNTTMDPEDVLDLEAVEGDTWTEGAVRRPNPFALVTVFTRATTTNNDNPDLVNSAEEPRPFVAAPFLSSAASVLVVALGVAVVISVFF